MSYAGMLWGRFEKAPLARKAFQYLELVIVFAVPLTFLALTMPKVGDSPFARQGVVWVANVAMLVIVYMGLRLRGQTWAHLGLHLGKPYRSTVARTMLLSLVVFIAATAAFLLGTVVIANVFGIPENSNPVLTLYIF